jgi:hypothetical protein
MPHDSRRAGRLFLLVATCVSAVTMLAQSPTLTTVSDTVFRADGAPASGTLLISWPAFTTSDWRAVAAGTKSVALSSGGAFTVQPVHQLVFRTMASSGSIPNAIVRR